MTTLDSARLGLEGLKSPDPRRRMAGLRNVIVWGRAVTSVLQTLRGTGKHFDDWYAPYVAEMRADPAMRAMYELRSRVLKEGDLPVHSSMTFTGNPGEIMRRVGPPPPGAKGFFIGDRIGGSGWEVALADGTTEKFYVEIPPIAGVSIEMKVHLSDAPDEVKNMAIEQLCERYLTYLEGVVDDARRRFGRPEPGPNGSV